MDTVQRLALALTIIGALNWGVAGLFQFDVVGQMGGGFSEPLSRFIYIAIGISGLLTLGLLFDKWRDRKSEHSTAEEA